MVSEEHRLCLLQVRVTGHHRLGMLGSEAHQRLAQLGRGAEKLDCPALSEQPRIQGDLVVAAPSGMQPTARRSDALREDALDGHVDVLVGDTELEGAVPDLPVDL
jgi:hypothetical protein